MEKSKRSPFVLKLLVNFYVKPGVRLNLHARPLLSTHRPFDSQAPLARSAFAGLSLYETCKRLSIAIAVVPNLVSPGGGYFRQFF